MVLGMIEREGGGGCEEGKRRTGGGRGGGAKVYQYPTRELEYQL